MEFKAKYCEHTGKFCYSSEAKAIRAKIRYTDIKRTYYCTRCDSWHITSQSYEAYTGKKKKKDKAPSISDIKKKIASLDKRIKKKGAKNK